MKKPFSLRYKSVTLQAVTFDCGVPTIESGVTVNDCTIAQAFEAAEDVFQWMDVTYSQIKVTRLTPMSDD